MCPTRSPPTTPTPTTPVADRIAGRESPAPSSPTSTSTPNPAAHEPTTGPEIWRQTDGRITHFVAGVGTGGTITGVGRAPQGAEPRRPDRRRRPRGLGVLRRHRTPYLVEGIGEDFWPATYDASVVDRVVAVSDRDSFLTARRLTRDEGILVGGSAARRSGRRLEVGGGSAPTPSSWC